jgi:type IV pilus assembly protein PilY1
MKKIILYILMFTLFFMQVKRGISANSCVDYSYIPATFTATVPPTVTIALDISGSMEWYAYYDSYNPDKDYEGLFDPKKVYKYSKINNNYKWVETTETAPECNTNLWKDTTPNTNTIASGSCLNWNYMTRIDIFQWAMTGGVPAECPGAVGNTQKCDPEIACSGDTCTIESYLGVKIELPLNDDTNHHGIMDAVLYQLKEKENRPRIGIMFFSGNGISQNGRSVYVGDFLTANSSDDLYPYKNLITSINTVTVDGATPSGPAMWDVWNYYLQKDAQYGGLDPDKGSDNSNHFKDPLWICNNGDGNGLKCQFAPCSSNYVILASDGQWNTPSNNIDYRDSNNNSPDPVVPAHKMHLGGKRDKDNVFVNIDAVYSFGMFLEGTGEKSLKNVAMYGAFDKDIANSDWPSGTNEQYPDNECYMDDAGWGKGSACEVLPSGTHPDWDSVDNLDRTSNPDGLPDTFFSAKNALELKEQLIAIFDDIMKRANSGTAIATVSTEKRETSMLYQAYYYPQFEDNNTTINWIGDIKTYFIDDKDNIREDSNNNNKLDLSSDSILLFKFLDTLGETRGFKIDDSDSDLIPDDCDLPSGDGFNLKNLNPIWSAASVLKNTNAENRKIAYNKDCTVNCTYTLDNNFINTNSDTVNYISNVWGLDTSSTEKLINFIRGIDYSDTRSRNTGSGVYKLGDIINSTPIVLKNQQVNAYDLIYNDSTYHSFVNSDIVTKRENLLFVGANDGMLHAFASGKIKDSSDSNSVAEVYPDNNTSLGQELWAFIPKNALPYLQWYFEEGKACHVPKVDYRFMLIDASIGDEQDKKDSWRTVLIGMMGFGGKKITTNNTYSSSIFALDVTDPLTPKLLWEYQLPDNTLTLSYPAIIRQGDKGAKGDWYLVVGSGPLDPNGKNFLTNPNSSKIYFINLKTGEKVLDLNVGKDIAISDIESLDVDHDYQADVILFGTYSSPDADVGSLYGIYLKSNSGYKTINNSLTLEKIIEVQRPIFAKTTNTIDSNYKLWLYLNTGRFLTNDDKIDNSTQYIIGIKDINDKWKDPTKTFYISFPSDLYNSSGTSVTASIKTVKCYCLGVECGDAAYDVNLAEYTCSKGYPVVTETTNAIIEDSNNGQCNDKSVTNCEAQITYGWFRELNNGERAYSEPFLAGGILDVLSFKPKEDLCSYGGDSYLNAIYYKTGTPYDQPMFLDSSSETSTLKIDDPNNPTIGIASRKLLGPGAPPIGQGITALPSDKDKFTKLIQTSVGAIIKQKQQADDTNSKLIFKILR